MDDIEHSARFHALTNKARFILRDIYIDLAEEEDDQVLGTLGTFYGVLCGACTAVVEVHKAVSEKCEANDPEGLLETLMQQMVDIWGQAHGFPAQQKRGATQ